MTENPPQHSWFDDRPWLKKLGEYPRLLREIPRLTMNELLARAIDEHGDFPAIKYYGTAITYRELGELVDKTAAYLHAQGFGAGDRLGLYMQNVPHYTITVFAVWKLGGQVVLLNPMYRDELLHIYADANVKALVVSAAAWNDRVSQLSGDIDIVLTVDDRDFVTDDEPEIFGSFPQRAETGQTDFLSAITAVTDTTVPAVEVTDEDPAMIGYTSGTSGKAKGAVLTHRNLATNCQSLAVRQDFPKTGAIYTLAPVFHITGFATALLGAVAARCTLVMNYRFNTAVALHTFRQTRPQYMSGPATAFLAMLAHPEFELDDFSSFTHIMSGGAPLPEAVVDNFEKRTGMYIGQGYGLTETSAQVTTVPNPMRAPVDPQSGNLSCGLPSANAFIRVLREDGTPADPGEVGEICASGPMVIREYLNNPEATARDIPGGELHTGDVGFMNAEGWLFIVDRMKDMINASGFKVWPREVEDVLYKLPGVAEAAVVGVPDKYRGESVAAYLTLKPGYQLTEEEVIAFAREHLAAFKAPHQVNFISELPKTASGKILRRHVAEAAKE